MATLYAVCVSVSKSNLNIVSNNYRNNSNTPQVLPRLLPLPVSSALYLYSNITFDAFSIAINLFIYSYKHLILSGFPLFSLKYKDAEGIKCL
jgi:hypothetical protein